ncbi:MAG: helical backbone metal receptor [Candidatus Thermoplasmatota archaeon]|jgi:iron complex transport system substrate-binding protein|nr:helical backbone metal receptor [Candidatus Thermoplasmatota archaeon]
MEMYKRPIQGWMKVGVISLLLSTMVLSVLTAGCLKEGGEGVRYKDDMGDTITLHYEPMRIVTLSPALAEIVFLLGRGDRICGRDSACNYPAEVEDILIVSTWQGPDLERLSFLEPDLVLMDRTLDLSGETYNGIKGLGIPVYRVYPRSVNDVFENIEDVGRLLGASSEANEVVGELKARADVVISAAAAIDASGRPVVLHVVYYDGTSDPWTATGSTFSGDMVVMAGGMNAVSDTGGMYVQVPVERLIASDPDIIVTSQSVTWPTSSRSTILNDASWRDITAVKNGRAYDVEGDWLDRPGPRCIDGLELVNELVMNVTGGG